MGRCCVIQTKLSASPFHSSDTGVGPIPSSSVSESTGGATIPARASAYVVPMVGCPAIGSSSAGVKIRTRASVSGRSGGRTNVVSEKFISFAIACIVALESPRPSSTTAS